MDRPALACLVGVAGCSVAVAAYVFRARRGRRAEYDLVIVGAGLIGSSAARHAVQLSTRGTRVALIGPRERAREEWGEREVFGAHHDEGRITRCTDPDPTWALLAQRSIDRYHTIEAQSGIAFFSEVGHLAVGPAGSATLRSRAENAASMSVPYEHLDDQALRIRFPYLTLPACSAGIWEPERSGHISARKRTRTGCAAREGHSGAHRAAIHAT